MRADYSEYKDRRKEMVKVISQALGIQAKYMRMPTCGYQIGEITVTKEAFLETGNEELLRQATGALAKQGFTAADAQEDTQTAGIPEEADSLEISVPADTLSDEEFGRLQKMVEAKATLLSHALGTEHIEVRKQDGKITFPWFSLPAQPEVAHAYTELVTKLCDLVRKQKRVTAREKDTNNEKYAFRCFLLRLGFIGADYKADRKILLRNLSGSSAFKSGHRKEEEA